ncbi:MAG TPA: cobalamin-dependent protein [Planctomycetota bacterium]|nr:cobalamin-dependent protein [Planctomycetota bacterium]
MNATPRFAASLLRASCRAYAAATVERLHASRPELLALPKTFAEPIDDTEVRILQLAASIAVDRPVLMQQAIAWYKVAFHHRGVGADYLAANLGAIEAVLGEELPAGVRKLVATHLAAAKAHLERAPVELPCLLSRSHPNGDLALHFLLSILEGRGEDALDGMRAALDRGLSVEALHDDVLAPVQRETGRMWLMGEIPIADEHYGSAIVERALALLQERVPRPDSGARTVLTMGVSGNLHDLGLRLVAQRLQGAGFSVRHLGGNMPTSDLEWALQDRPVDLIAISAVMTLHLPALIEAVAQVRRIAGANGANGRTLPVLVGGPPFGLVPDLHEVVGADAAAVDARSAVLEARRLVAGA